jgi:RNA polymerase sigma factor (sigma-70 family)
MISDQDLIARVVAHQDQHAFSQLVLRYQSQLRSWARRLSDGDIHSADDLAQEAFIKAYKALSAFRGDSKFSTWLYRITFNIAANRWRGKKIQWRELDDNEEVECETSEIDQYHAKKDLAAAMQLLSPAQKMAISLCFEDGFSHEEAALVMGLPLGTLKTHINRGKQKLQHALSAWQGALHE